MKNLVFTLATAELENPIQNSILDKINLFKEEKLLCEKAVSKRVKEMFEIRNSVMAQLNKELGSDAWFLDKRYIDCYSSNNKRFHDLNENTQRCFSVSIGFRNGVYKNTCYNDWDLIIQTPWKEEKKLSDLTIKVPNLDIVEMYLIKSNGNFNKKNTKDKIGFLITDLADIHKHLEADYITYFLQKEKNK